MSDAMKSAYKKASSTALPLFLASQFALLAGTSLGQVVVSWLIFDRSGSSMLLGAVGCVAGLFAAVAALLAGVWSDRREPRVVLIATQTAAAVASAGLLAVALLGPLETAPILVFAAAASFLSGPAIPMQQALLASLVSRREIGATVATSSIVYDLARIAGPAIGGFVLAHASVPAALLVGALWHGLSAGALLLQRAPAGARAARPDWRDVLAEGFRYVASSRAILAIIGLSACICVATTALTVLMPVMVGKLGGSPQTLGLLLAALSAGAIGGSLFLRFHSELTQLPRRIASGAMTLGVCMVLFALAPTVLLAFGALLGTGFALNIVMTSCTSVLLSVTSAQVRGRVMTCFALSFMGVAPLSSLAAGFVAEMGSASYTIAGAAVVSLLAGALFLRIVAPLKRLL